MDTIRRNWWLILAAVAGTLQVAMAISVPFEDRTLGAIAGGAVTGAAGIAMLAGIRVRRERRTTGDLLIAGGTLPLMAWLWTLVLPLLALAVALPALLDAADAGSRGTDSTGRGSTQAGGTHARATTVLTGMVMATAALAAVMASPYLVLALVAPTLGLLVGLLATTRVAVPLVRAGLVLAAAGLVQGVITWILVSDLLVSWNDLAIDAGSGSVTAALVVSQAAIVLGAVLVLVGLARRTRVPKT